MYNSTRIILLVFCFSWIINGQEQALVIDSTNIPSKSIAERFPEISKDSTIAEVTAHVIAMNKWMRQQHYKLNYAPPLIYADTALYLAKKTGNKIHLHKTRSIIGNKRYYKCEKVVFRIFK